jgi:glutamate-1-semialdehyde aminotransferase
MPATASLIAVRPTSPWGPGARDLTVRAARGAEVTLSDGRTYLDLMNGKGSVVLGHNHAEVNAAIERHLASSAACATGWGEHAFELARELAADSGVPDARLALFSTGTEACRAAALLARRATGRSIVLSCGYHGWDPMWTPGARLLEPGPDGVVDCFFVPALIEEALARYRDRIALFMFSPDYVYLRPETLRALVDPVRAAGVLICCDDVKQGYRHCPGSYLPAHTGRAADLYTFSKGLSNGHRVSAVVGPEPVMRRARNFTYTSVFDELGVAAARATLHAMKRDQQYTGLAARVSATLDRMRAQLAEAGAPVAIHSRGATFQFVCATARVETAFHAACFAAGLLVFEGDNQMPSAAYDGPMLDELAARFARVVEALRGLPAEPITPQRTFRTAWSMIDGAADLLPHDETIAAIHELAEWS